MASGPAADVAARFTRGGLWVSILVMGCWHIIASLPFVVMVWASHGVVPSGAPVWAGYAALGTVSAITALRDGREPSGSSRADGPRAGLTGARRPHTWQLADWWHRGWRSGALPWALCVLLLAGVLASALTMPTGFFGSNMFAFTSAGWFALVALWHRRLAELLAFLAANAVAGLLALALLHAISRAYLAMFLMEWVGSSVFQVTIYVGSRAVAAVAGRAAQAEDDAMRARYTRLAADAVQAERRTRYELVRATVVRLLEGLATGTLDLDAAPSRQEIAVAVTRLRRFLVENDDVPDPLSHELRACADTAEQRGVAVDLIAAAGTIPLLPVSVRRALVEPVIQVLAATASRARVTVISSSSEVLVAIVADASLPRLDLAMADDVVRCDWDKIEGNRLWVQARSSASLSSTTTTWSSKESGPGSRPTRSGRRWSWGLARRSRRP